MKPMTRWGGLVLCLLGCVAFGESFLNTFTTGGIDIPGTNIYPQLSLEHIGPLAPSAGSTSRVIIVDTYEEFGYLSTGGTRLSIVKAKLPDLEQIDLINIPMVGSGTQAAVLHPASNKAFFAFGNPSRVIGVNLSDFTLLSNVTTNSPGEFVAASLGPSLQEVTFYTNSSPPFVITVEVENGTIVRETRVEGWELGKLSGAVMDLQNEAAYITSNHETVYGGYTYPNTFLAEYHLPSLQQRQLRHIQQEGAVSIARKDDGELVLATKTRENSTVLRTISPSSFLNLQHKLASKYEYRTVLAMDQANEKIYLGVYKSGTGLTFFRYRMSDLVLEESKTVSIPWGSESHLVLNTLQYLSKHDALFWTERDIVLCSWTSSDTIREPFYAVEGMSPLFQHGGFIYGHSSPFLYKIDPASGAAVEKISFPSANKLAAIVPQTNTAYISAHASGRIWVLDLLTFQIKGISTPEPPPTGIGSLFYDAQRNALLALISRASKSKLVRYNLSSFAEESSLDLVTAGYADNGFIDKENRYLYLCTYKALSRFDLDQFSHSGSIPFPQAVTSVYYEPASDKAYALSEYSLAKIDLRRFRWEDEVLTSGAHRGVIDHVSRTMYLTSTASLHKIGLGNFELLGTRAISEESQWPYGLVFNDAAGTLHLGSMQLFSTPRTVAYRIAHTNSLNASPFQLTEKANVRDMRFYSHQAGGNLRLALYSAGETKELIWESDTVPNETTEGTIVVPIAEGIPSSLVLEPGSYHLAWQSDSTIDSPSFTKAVGGLRLWMPFGPSPAALTEQAKEVEQVWTQYITYNAILPPPPVEDPAQLEGLFSSWYFAEGAAYPQFDTYYLVANPHAEPIEVEVELLPESGAPTTFTMTIAAESRLTIRANDHVSNTGVSAILREKNNKTFAAERAMYSVGEDGKWRGAHATVGITELASDWYLAEGSTAQAGPAMNPFEYFILLANPNEVDVTTDLTFFLQGDEAPVTAQFTVPAKRRITVFANNLDPRLYERSFSTRVQTPNGEPIAVERSMWWRAANWPDNAYMEGNASPGITELSTSWYLAEGNTSDEEFILLANPGTTDADVTVRYLLEGSDPVTRTLTVPAQRRRTINVRYDAEGLGLHLRHGTEITSSAPIAVERSQYFSNGGFGWVGGHHSVASPTLTKQWVLPEGAEVPVGTSWLRTEFLVANPGTESAKVELRFLLGSGDLVTETLTVPAGQRATFTAGNVKALGGKAFGTHIISDQPIVAERSMYFGLDEIDRIGATCSMGIPLMPQVPTKVYGEPVLQIAGPAHVLQTHTPTPTLTPTPTPAMP